MHIYFSGIGGVGIGPLAEIALDAGHVVSGSDAQETPMTKRLIQRGARVHIGQTTEEIARINANERIDWFVHTSALPPHHPEFEYARLHGIRTSKRDELLARIIKDHNLKLIAVSGTHGKTTTTAMLVWLFQQFHVPVSYSIGTTISFGPSGKFDPGSEYMVYEADEYDRNFLHFSPHTALITSLDYDHPEIFPTEHSYFDAFRRFITQSRHTIMWHTDAIKVGSLHNVRQLDETSEPYDSVKLPGAHTRRNAWLAGTVMSGITDGNMNLMADHLAKFPGTHRRFEKLADNLYSDYGHHPVEIAATLQMARELNDHVILVYQPHHNVRQHEMQDQYADCMKDAEHIYWLPTYLAREDPHLAILSPEHLRSKLTNKQNATVANLNDDLWYNIQTARKQDKLVICMGAGSIDAWVRERLQASENL